jgi:hypothetical protein
MEGRSEVADGRSELVRLAARLIIEEALEGEAGDALGRDYYARGAAHCAGYRNGYRTGRVKSAEGAIDYSAPQIADRSEPFRSRIRGGAGPDGKPWRWRCMHAGFRRATSKRCLPTRTVQACSAAPR